MKHGIDVSRFVYNKKHLTINKLLTYGLLTASKYVTLLLPSR